MSISATTYYTIPDYSEAKVLVDVVTAESYDTIVNLINTFNKMSAKDKDTTIVELEALVAEYNAIIAPINNDLDAAKDIAKNTTIPYGVAVAMLGIFALAVISMKKIGGAL